MSNRIFLTTAIAIYQAAAYVNLHSIVWFCMPLAENQANLTAQKPKCLRWLLKATLRNTARAPVASNDPHFRGVHVWGAQPATPAYLCLEADLTSWNIAVSSQLGACYPFDTILK